MDATDEFGIGMLIEDGGIVRLRPSGELDLYTAPRLEEAVREQIRPGRVLVVDLSKTTFVDSSGMGTLVRLAKVVAAGGGTFKLTSPTRSIARLFEISGVHSFLDVSLDAAE